MPEDTKDLSGKYVLRTWIMTGNARLPPGLVVELSSEEATKLLASDSVKPYVAGAPSEIAESHAVALLAATAAQGFLAEVEGLDKQPTEVKLGDPIEPQPMAHAPGAIIPELDKDAHADAPSVTVTSATEAPASTDTEVLSERRTGAPRKRSGG